MTQSRKAVCQIHSPPAPLLTPYATPPSSPAMSSSAKASKDPHFSLRNPSTLATTTDSDSDTAPDPVLSADPITSTTRTLKRNAVNIDGFSSDSDADNFDRRASKKARDEKLQRSQQEEENDMFAELKDDIEGGDGSDEDAKIAAAAGGKKKKGVRFVHKDNISGQDLTSKSGGHVSSRINLNLNQASSSAQRSSKGKSKSRADTTRRRERSASFSSVSSAHSQSSASSTSISDSERARADSVDAELGAGSKKTHAPLLDAFNMRSEQTEGAFDESGNYVRKSGDPDAVHDMWMEGVSKKEMKKAREAAERREDERRKREREEDKDIGELLSVLIPVLERGETVLEALARLGSSKRKAQSKVKEKQKPKWQTKQKQKHATKTQHTTTNGQDTNGHAQDATMTDAPSADPSTDKTNGTSEADRITHQIEQLTSAADLLLTKGQTKAQKIYADIYDTEREMLVRQYTRETGEEWVDPPSRVEGEGDHASERQGGENGGGRGQWQYRWTDARDGGMINGPYESKMMQAWSEAGYFGEGVEFRQIGGGEWSRVPDF